MSRMKEGRYEKFLLTYIDNLENWSRLGKLDIDSEDMFESEEMFRGPTVAVTYVFSESSSDAYHLKEVQRTRIHGVMSVPYVPRTDFPYEKREKMLFDLVNAVLRDYYKAYACKGILENLKPGIRAILADSFFRVR